jgi:ribosomal protein L12E/L44/L45/RPP1/RPP2
MSDINRKTQTATQIEGADLSELASAKDLHQSPTASPANATDLASASISPADVLRVSQRTDIRKSVHERVPAQETAVELTNSRSKSSAPRSTEAGAKQGIFKNAFYRYDGGLLNKILALIGNILKVIERLFLRLLGARDAVAPPSNPQSTSSKRDDKTTDSSKQELEKENRKERREQAELLVKRQ